MLDTFFKTLEYKLVDLAYSDQPPLRAKPLSPPAKLPPNPIPEPDLKTALMSRRTMLIGIGDAALAGAAAIGAASMLAAQGRDLAQVGATMLMFGVGVALPLLALGVASREAALRWRGRLGAVSERGKPVLGLIAAVAGLLVLTGLDQRVEAALVAASPDWLVQLTMRF